MPRSIKIHFNGRQIKVPAQGKTLETLTKDCLRRSGLSPQDQTATLIFHYLDEEDDVVSIYE